MDTATQPTPSEPRAQPFRYETPQMPTDGRHVGKYVVRLARTDRMLANVQVLKHGGENNLHSHPHLDGLWMVLKGRVRFYGEGDVVIAELGEREGVLIPRHYKYWFEAVGDEVLELLQVEAADFPMPMDRPPARQDFTPMTDATRNVTLIDARVNEPTYQQAKAFEWVKP